MVIPRFVQAALEGKQINIFGDGSQSRVFCHVYDATKATTST
jgi:UDP-glucose 4-epimerase